MTRPSAELRRRGVPRRPGDPASSATHETLLSIDKARRVLGYEPKFTWRTAAPA